MEAQLGTERHASDVGEVVAYVRAMNHGLNRLATLPVSVRLIREIHRELLRGARGSHLEPGELRRSQNWIGPAGCTLAEATFVPPPPSEVPGALGALETFLHQDDRLPLLVQIGLAHAQVETIHPFLDGNGRIALLQAPPRRVLRPTSSCPRPWRLRGVARIFPARRGRSEREGCGHRWRILELREQHRRSITTSMGRAAGNGHRALDHLYEQPIVSVTDVRELLGTTFPGANQIVRRLVDLKILVEITGQARHRRFRYDGYIKLFEEGTEL